MFLNDQNKNYIKKNRFRKKIFYLKLFFQPAFCFWTEISIKNISK